MTVQRLACDFGGKAELTHDGVAALVQVLAGKGQPAAEAGLSSWLAIFRKTCGQDWPRPSSKLGTLSGFYGVATDSLRPEAVLFALHTWYILVIRLLVGHVMAQMRGIASPAERLASAATSDSLREQIEELENGGMFRRLNMADPFRDHPFSWYADAASGPVEQAVRQLGARLQRYDARPQSAEAGAHDFLKPLYQSLLPRSLRHAMGEYYTPDWLAEHVLDQVGYQGEPPTRLIDPTCGSGTFLLAAMRRLRAHRSARGDQLCRRILENIVGLDLHPLAVMTARANYLMAIADLMPHAEQIEVPVYACDAILDGPGPVGLSEDGFDYVVGNPPWIAWDNLPNDYRQATRPLWEHYGLFSLSGRDARHGGGKKDLSMLVLYVSADRYLRHGGHLGMVITQTLFQTKGAGDGFRRFRLGPDGPWLRVLRVDDMVALKPFDDAANWTSTVVLEKGLPTQYPVPYVKWLPGKDGGEQHALLARPIEPQRSSSPWLVWPESCAMDVGRLVGRSDYTAHLGANSGGANAVYWLEVLGAADGGVRVRNLVEKGKAPIEQVEAVIEPDLLYPLVRWIDVDRYVARPSAHLLLAQDVVARSGVEDGRMRQAYPRTYAYLKQFEPLLIQRAAYRRYQDHKPFYSMYNVGPYTLSPAKVVWRRMDRRIRAAVLEEIDDARLGRRPVVPQETCVLVACQSGDEAHYLCAMLNSSPVHFLVASHSVAGGKGFGTPSILDFIPLRRFDPMDPRHAELAACSRQAHRLAGSSDALAAAARGGEDLSGPTGILDELQRRIDRLAAGLWGIGAHELPLAPRE